MKKLFVILPFSIMLAVLAGCGEAPEVQAAHKAQQKALVNAQVNLNAYAKAALADLQTALNAQIDLQLAAKAKTMADAQGKIDLAAYNAELAKAAAAKDAVAAKIANAQGKFDGIMIDVNNSVKIGDAIDAYLNRKNFTTQDAVDLITEVQAILAGATTK